MVSNIECILYAVSCHAIYSYMCMPNSLIYALYRVYACNLDVYSGTYYTYNILIYYMCVLVYMYILYSHALYVCTYTYYTSYTYIYSHIIYITYTLHYTGLAAHSVVRPCG